MPTPADPGGDRSGHDLDRLVRVLDDELSCHRELADRLREKKLAVKSADVERITALCEQERTLLDRIAGLRRRRLGLVTRLAGEAETASLTAVAATADPGRRERLEELGDALRREIEQIRRQGAVVARAAAALSRHVNGILTAINGALNGVGIYERKGRIATATQVDCRVDLKS